jgi:hypothetical protein
MGKTVRLTESDLNRIIKSVIKEGKEIPNCEGIKYIMKDLKGIRSGWSITDEKGVNDTVIITRQDGYEPCRAKKSEVFI